MRLLRRKQETLPASTSRRAIYQATFDLLLKSLDELDPAVAKHIRGEYEWSWITSNDEWNALLDQVTRAIERAQADRKSLETL